MNIAIDLDGTLDQDPVMWSGIAYAMQERGHTVYLVTCRRGTESNKDIVEQFLLDWDIDIPKGRRYFTSLGPKSDYMDDLGIKIDLWIDDDPGCIIKGK